jgi:hypothetical protein
MNVLVPVDFSIGEGISPQVAAALFTRALQERGIAQACVLFAHHGIKATGSESKELAALNVYGELVREAFRAGLESGYAMGREVFGGGK